MSHVITAHTRRCGKVMFLLCVSVHRGGIPWSSGLDSRGPPTRPGTGQGDPPSGPGTGQGDPPPPPDLGLDRGTPDLGLDSPEVNRKRHQKWTRSKSAGGRGGEPRGGEHGRYASCGHARGPSCFYFMITWNTPTNNFDIIICNSYAWHKFWGFLCIKLNSIVTFWILLQTGKRKAQIVVAKNPLHSKL